MMKSGKPAPRLLLIEFRRVAGHTLLCNQKLRFVDRSLHTHPSEESSEKISIFVQTHGQRMSQSILGASAIKCW